jgi:hypothetical protein
VVSKCGESSQVSPPETSGGSEESLSLSLGRFHRRSEVECIWRVCRDVRRNVGLCLTITVIIVNRHPWPVDRSPLKVWPSKAVELGIYVKVETTLEDWVIRKVDIANNVSRLELNNPLAQEELLK